MKLLDSLAYAGGKLAELARYMGFGASNSPRSVDSAERLVDFIDSRASHVGQSALYGYLKTRAGTRFPQLFENPAFLESINIAKWQIWAASVSDLVVFAGALSVARGADPSRVAATMGEVVETIFDRAGSPAEAGSDFETSLANVRERVRACDWSSVGDDESAFTESPAALFYWAPVVDELKQYDEQIVRNSIRFRWIEVRRALRHKLDASFLID